MAVDLPNNGRLVSSGGFGATDLTIMLRWRFASLAALPLSANLFFIGTSGSGSIGLGRNYNASTFHLYVFSDALAYQGSTGNFTPDPGVWHACIGRIAGTNVTRWHNASQAGPFGYSGIGTAANKNLYLNHDVFASDHQGDYDFADVVVLHEALTDAEILGFADGASGANWARRAMSYWPMIDWLGSPVRDVCGYRDLTLDAGTPATTDHPRIRQRPARRLITLAAPVGTEVRRVVPDAIVASTNLSGAVGAVQTDDGTWLTATSPTAATDLRVSYPTP